MGIEESESIIEMFEMMMRGDVDGEIKEFREKYDVGEENQVVMKDIEDLKNMVKRMSLKKDVEEDVQMQEDERVRGRELEKKI